MGSALEKGIFLSSFLGNTHIACFSSKPMSSFLLAQNLYSFHIMEMVLSLLQAIAFLRNKQKIELVIFDNLTYTIVHRPLP